ncbi:helix-turn-helix domain-containing protein [Virgifigura deserti]|uniref:helix-turn-helix domain-containing protein n=1 Tax=Virgifigura deserti TaxID=2268457 RepID=UPI003CCBDF65
MTEEIEPDTKPAPRRRRGSVDNREPAASADAAMPELGQLIGERLRQLRRLRGATLESLAHSTGFTRGYLSKIENSRKVPPIASLARISQALETDIAYFFTTAEAPEPQDDKVSVVRAGERRRVERGGTTFGYDYASVAYRKRHKHMEPFVFTYPSNLSRDVSFEHEGEELVFVLSGRVEFEADGKKFVLEPGDTLYLDSEVPHRARSLGGEAKAFVVIFKPEKKAT